MESFTGAGTAIGPAIGGFLRPVGLSDELYLIYEFDTVTVSQQQVSESTTKLKKNQQNPWAELFKAGLR